MAMEDFLSMLVAARMPQVNINNEGTKDNKYDQL